jgi:DNA-binding beta-propeller fold protein YncE
MRIRFVFALTTLIAVTVATAWTHATKVVAVPQPPATGPQSPAATAPARRPPPLAPRPQPPALAGARQPLAIPINVAGRPAGAVECVVSVGPTVPITALAFSPNGKTLAAGGYDEVLLWDLGAAKLARRIAVGGRVGVVAFSKDGRTLFVGEGKPGRRGAVRFIDLAGGEEVFRADEPQDVVTALAVSPDGTFLAAAGGAQPLAYVWNVRQKKLAATLRGHSDRVLSVSFSADGKLLATGGADSVAQIWKVGEWTATAKFTEAGPVRGSAFHPDGVQILLAVAGPQSAGLQFRKTDSPAYRRPIGTGAGMPLGMLGPSAAGRVCVPCSDKTLKVFDIRNGRLVATLAGHQDWVYAAALSPDGTRLASGSGDGTVRLWSNQDYRLLATLVQLAPRAEKWLIVAAEGYLATSSPGELAWKAGKPPAKPSQWLSQLRNPESLGKAMAGARVRPPVLK